LAAAKDNFALKELHKKNMIKVVFVIQMGRDSIYEYLLAQGVKKLVGAQISGLITSKLIGVDYQKSIELIVGNNQICVTPVFI
jgi:hypothetical protein